MINEWYFDGKNIGDDPNKTMEVFIMKKTIKRITAAIAATAC